MIKLEDLNKQYKNYLKSILLLNNKQFRLCILFRLVNDLLDMKWKNDKLLKYV
jgi:hypothetical protein